MDDSRTLIKQTRRQKEISKLVVAKLPMQPAPMISPIVDEKPRHAAYSDLMRKHDAVNQRIRH